MDGYSIGMVNDTAAVQFVKGIISQGVARLSVPFFYLIAGYLFAGDGPFRMERYVKKLKCRVWTLLVPFILWNLATLAVFAFGQSQESTRRFFAHTEWPPVASFGLHDYLNSILGLGRPCPISFQFWFVRDLIALVLFAPAIYFLFSSRIGIPLVSAMSVLWIMDAWPLLWPSVEATFFFVAGSYLAYAKVDTSALDRYGKALMVLFSIALCCDASLKASFCGQYVHKAMILLGIPAIWWAAGRIAGHKGSVKNWLTTFSGASFFVFAAHEPLLSIVRKLAFRAVQPNSGASILSLYFLVPVFLIAFLLACYRGMNALAPTFVAVITGERFRKGSLVCSAELPTNAAAKPTAA
jgi:surface polysaccharide O-acyltransferase-like enzyme